MRSTRAPTRACSRAHAVRKFVCRYMKNINARDKCKYEIELARCRHECMYKRMFSYYRKTPKALRRLYTCDSDAPTLAHAQDWARPLPPRWAPTRSRPHCPSHSQSPWLCTQPRLQTRNRTGRVYMLMFGLRTGKMQKKCFTSPPDLRTIWYSTVARLVHRRCWLDLRCSTNPWSPAAPKVTTNGSVRRSCID